MSQNLSSAAVMIGALGVKFICFQYVSEYTEELPLQLFDRFMLHMAKCAAANRSLSQREARRIHLTNLFLSCDHSGVSYFPFSILVLPLK